MCHVTQAVLPLLAGRIVTLVVVPGVLVTVAAVLGLLERKKERIGSRTEIKHLLTFLV